MRADAALGIGFAGVICTWTICNAARRIRQDRADDRRFEELLNQYEVWISKKVEPELKSTHPNRREEIVQRFLD